MSDLQQGPDCLCSHRQFAHRLGRRGCRALDCGCDRYEPVDEPQPAPAMADPEPEPELDPADQYAAHLADLGRQLAVRVRDNHPADNQQWLHEVLPDLADREALLYVLAAAVPLNRSMQSLTAWAEQDRESRLQPHGTHAAAERHRYRKEPLCDECRQAERERDRDRKKTAYWAAKGEPATTTEETRAA
ncbi:hypothetical protein [Micromonospora sp. NPDC051006]|uniref:hypothetical protein n=1 Tax=Micromonospora sp. NPDC051006 TaxID=3364283 RepID=UPI0037A75928